MQKTKAKCKEKDWHRKHRWEKLLPSLSSSRNFFSMWIKSDIHQLLLLLWIKSAVISGPLHPPCSLQLLTPYVWLRFPSPIPPVNVSVSDKSQQDPSKRPSRNAFSLHNFTVGHKKIKHEKYLASCRPHSYNSPADFKIECVWRHWL